MNVLSYPLRYLTLRDEHGSKLYRRNGVTLIVVSALLATPFIAADVNFFSDKGFLDRVGSFSAVLTGFYIAALVGIASFASSLGDLDDVIKVGRITTKDEDGQDLDLTRRQYVCSLFGYLSFVSLLISVSAILSVVLVESRGALRVLLAGHPQLLEILADCQIYVRAGFVIFFSVIIAHMLVTTCHGLYYLIDRLYAKKPRLLPKSDSDPALIESDFVNDPTHP